MEFANLRTSEDNNMKQHIATMAILTMIAASAFADFASDVNFLTNGVLGGGKDHVDRCIRGLRKRAGLSDDDLAERLLFVADAFAESTNVFQNKKGSSAISAVGRLNTTNPLPRLERYLFEFPRYRTSSLGAFANLSKCDDRYLQLCSNLLSKGIICRPQAHSHIFFALERNATNPEYISNVERENMISFLLAHPELTRWGFPSYDMDVCKYYKPYAMSIERLRNIRIIVNDTNVNWEVRERFSNEVVRLNGISITNLLDLKSLGVINAETNAAIQSKAVREFLKRAKEEEERERASEKSNRPKARWIQ